MFLLLAAPLGLAATPAEPLPTSFRVAEGDPDAASAATAGLWWFWATKFQHTRFGRRMTLTAADTGTAQAAGLTKLTGQTGTAITPLRPSGTILIAGKRVDAITGGDFVEKGTGVIVVRVEGTGVIVHRRD